MLVNRLLSLTPCNFYLRLLTCNLQLRCFVIYRFDSPREIPYFPIAIFEEFRLI